MSRYTGPKARVNRRLGLAVFESAGALKAMDRKPNPPGMQPPPRKLTEYALAMREKQKIKFYYGLHERQLRKLYDLASRGKGDTGRTLLTLCERRIDNVIRLAGLAKTRPQARQGVAHGHFLLNGRAHDIPSATVSAGDVIDVRRKPHLGELYLAIRSEIDGPIADWLAFDPETLRIIVHRLPTSEDVTLPVDVQLVVELMSR
jgi:small subunit ribosomal protein S4